MNLEDLCSASALQALSKLLSPPEEEEDDLEQVSYPSSAVGALSPGNIGPAKKEESKVNPPNNTENRKDIWDPEEVPEGLEFDDMWDPREQPEYDIIFKQQVGAEDVFLGMTRKDPSTACCEDLLLYWEKQGRLKRGLDLFLLRVDGTVMTDSREKAQLFNSDFVLFRRVTFGLEITDQWGWGTHMQLK
ncbi:dynein axonemal assembly factor 6 isoform X3 [Sminthopsis crassicaudata]|uniref:dynein axonemal assembly factor 6 isoform X3 n=1 Tax=Sminthopsis crassicaudata TaxID=9301 RepID=UPI003D68DDE5